jgi:cytochrome c peroxidase
VCSLGQISFRSSTDDPQNLVPSCEIYLQQQGDSLTKALSKFRVYIEHDEYDNAKKAFLECRSIYKRIELFITYFFPGDAAFINGANEEEIEDDDEPDFIISPQGFQVIEALLYEDDATVHKLKLVQKTDSLNELINNCITATGTFPIDQRVFFEAMQMQLIRLFMLTAVNFETPYSKHAAAEMISSFESMKTLITRAFPAAHEGRLAVLRVFCETLVAATKYIGSYSSIDQVDYFKLYSKYYIPLSDQLRTARGNLVTNNYQSVTAIDLNATSVFDQSAFNTFFFNPVQVKTGSPERAALGKLLFFDPVLSENTQRSCASCHKPELAFTDGLPKSISMDGKSTVNRNAPSLINAAIQGRLFHDARTMNLENQADEVLGNPLEMHHDFSSSVGRLKRSPEYVRMFQEAFKGTPDSFISGHSILLAIAEYERTLVSFNSRFDKSIRGEENTLTSNELNGFQLFITKGNCAGCHFIPLFSGTRPPEYKVSEWEVLGVPDVNDRSKAKLDSDPGRAGVHKTALYRHAFKTPGLRNIAYTAPYMHNGVFSTLEEVMDFYNSGGGKAWGLDVPNQSLDADSLRLTKEEIQNIISFLNALSDTVGMTSRPASLPEFPKDPELANRKIGGLY